jgi:hypothetical protein
MDRRARLRTCGGSRGGGLSAANLTSQRGERNRRNYDCKIDHNNGELISQFHIFTSLRLIAGF